jgi:hypothetical protein
MKIFLSFFLMTLIFPFGAQAFEKEACISNLTDNYFVNSKSFTIDTDRYNVRDYGNDHLAFAILMVRLTLKEEGCQRDVVNFGQGPLGRATHSCELLVPGREYSRSCYIETNLGAFIITTDFQTLAHVIYKRWD